MLGIEQGEIVKFYVEVFHPEVPRKVLDEIRHAIAVTASELVQDCVDSDVVVVEQQSTTTRGIVAKVEFHSTGLPEYLKQESWTKRFATAIKVVWKAHNKFGDVVVRLRPASKHITVFIA